MFKSTMIAGAGGAVGTILRFLCERLGAVLCAGAFPLGTFIANVLGCYLIGVFYGWVQRRKFMTKNLNLLLITGLCGGFTTFSSFSDEMVTLLESCHTGTFVWYLCASLVAGVLCVVAGIASVRPKAPAAADNV